MAKSLSILSDFKLFLTFCLVHRIKKKKGPGDIFIEILLIFELPYIEVYLYDTDVFSRRT